jgi:hypothetical protein
MNAVELRPATPTPSYEPATPAFIPEPVLERAQEAAAQEAVSAWPAKPTAVIEELPVAEAVGSASVPSSIEEAVARARGPATQTEAHPAETYRAKAIAKPLELPPDLVQVETSQNVSQPPAQFDAAGEVTQARRPRRPHAEPAIESQPLVQIETRSGPTD